jgi:hypothetical protein
MRGNRDTLSSSAVFDLETGPVPITLPDAGKRFRRCWQSIRMNTRPGHSTMPATAVYQETDRHAFMQRRDARDAAASFPWDLGLWRSVQE